MEPYERIRYLRKNILNLSQEEFSNKINISRPNLGNIENGKIKLTERVLTDVCREFNINQEWIINGINPIFQKNGNPLDNRIINLYYSLTDRNKERLYGYIQRLLEEQDEK
ncbi:helix-turn-helix transcriptional regulator [Lachnospiraceae bacterium NSJ-143]|nr:helix-turn-helix transcriptional regulator [Lachnospiraceae bacterium NSJ-143]